MVDQQKFYRWRLEAASIHMNDSIGDIDAIELLTESYDTLDTENSIETAD